MRRRHDDHARDDGNNPGNNPAVARQDAPPLVRDPYMLERARGTVYEAEEVAIAAGELEREFEQQLEDLAERIYGHTPAGEADIGAARELARRRLS